MEYQCVGQVTGDEVEAGDIITVNLYTYKVKEVLIHNREFRGLDATNLDLDRQEFPVLRATGLYDCYEEV